MDREFGLTHLLIGLCALVTLIVAAEWVVVRIGVNKSRALMERPVKSNYAFDSMERVEFSLPPEEIFEEIIERPLMIRGRRPVDETTVVPEAPVVAAKTDLKMKLMGVIMTPAGMTALLQDSSGKYKRVKLNGQLEGWEVTELKADKVVLTQGNNRQELMLRKPKPKIPRSAKSPAAKKSSPGKRNPRAKRRRVKPKPKKVKKESLKNE